MLQLEWNRLIHSFGKKLLDAYHLLSIMPATGDKIVNQRENVPQRPYILVKEMVNKHII